MSRTIPVSACNLCGTCASTCPYGAISLVQGRYKIDPNLCKNCKDEGGQPVCVITCPGSLPQASKARRGRGRLLSRGAAELEAPAENRKMHFASCLPVWEAANLLSQGLDACQGEQSRLLIERQASQVWMGLGLAAELRADAKGSWRSPEEMAPLPRNQALKALNGFDPRNVALHLLLAARATGLNEAWAETIVLDDRYLERMLGLDRRRDLNRPERLSLIKTMMLQVLRLVLVLRCEAIGSLPELTISKDPLWRLLELEHHFQTDELGQTHLAGLTFHLRAGGWSRYFLNAAGQREQTALLQYGQLPMELPRAVMRHWQQHPGAVRLLVWLLFKLRLGQQHTLLVSTLMRIAYGQQRLQAAGQDRELRKRLVRSYEADLLVLLEEGLRARFHPQLYPDEIRPLWHTLEEVPDDPEEAIAYWTRDGASDQSLTDQAPRNKYRRLMQARIQGFDLDGGWRQGRGERSNRRALPAKGPQNMAKADPLLQPQAIQEARLRLGLSQRSLAGLMQRSQSWVRDLESGRCKASATDRQGLERVLELKAPDPTPNKSLLSAAPSG